MIFFLSLPFSLFFRPRAAGISSRLKSFLFNMMMLSWFSLLQSPANISDNSFNAGVPVMEDDTWVWNLQKSFQLLMNLTRFKQAYRFFCERPEGNTHFLQIGLKIVGAEPLWGCVGILGSLSCIQVRQFYCS